MFLISILRVIVLFFFISYSQFSLANDKIFHIDIDYIMNNSIAGKSIIKQLDTISKKNLSELKKIEDKLKKEETKIISQKNILDKKEYEKIVTLFTNKVSSYQKKRSTKIEEINLKKSQAQSTLVGDLTNILTIYSKKNNISYIVPKQNIIIGKKELDITNKILKELDLKITTIKVE